MTKPSSSTLSSDFWVGVAAAPLFVVIFATMFFPFAILRAWVMTVIWGWYVISAFGMTPLRMVYAFGLAMLVHEMTPKYHMKDDRKWRAIITAGILGPLGTLAVAWIGTFFI